MKNAIAFILLFVILLLSAVGCADRKNDPPVGGSGFISGETEITTDSFADAQTAPSADPTFVPGDDGVDLPIDAFD